MENQNKISHKLKKEKKRKEKNRKFSLQISGKWR